MPKAINLKEDLNIKNDQLDILMINFIFYNFKKFDSIVDWHNPPASILPSDPNSTWTSTRTWSELNLNFTTRLRNVVIRVQYTIYDECHKGLFSDGKNVLCVGLQSVSFQTTSYWHLKKRRKVGREEQWQVYKEKEVRWHGYWS